MFIWKREVYSKEIICIVFYHSNNPFHLYKGEVEVSSTVGGLITIAGENSIKVDYYSDRVFAKKTLKLTLEGVVESPHFKLTDAENVANWAQR